MVCMLHQKISILTLRVEGDRLALAQTFDPAEISILTLRVEGDRYDERIDFWLDNFNPHPPRGG